MPNNIMMFATALAPPSTTSITPSTTTKENPSYRRFSFGTIKTKDDKGKEKDDQQQQHSPPTMTRRSMPPGSIGAGGASGVRRNTLQSSSDHTRSSRHGGGRAGSGTYDSSYHSKSHHHKASSSRSHPRSSSASHRDSLNSNKDKDFDDNMSEVSLDTALLHEATNQNLHKEWPELLADLKLELAQTKAELDSQGFQVQKLKTSNKSLENQLYESQSENRELKQQIKDLEKRLWVQGTLSTNSNTNSSSSHHRRSLDAFINNTSSSHRRGTLGPGCSITMNNNGGDGSGMSSGTRTTEEESYHSSSGTTNPVNPHRRSSSSTVVTTTTVVQLRDLISDDDSDDGSHHDEDSIGWEAAASPTLHPKGSKGYHDSVQTIEFQESSATIPEEDLPQVQEEEEEGSSNSSNDDKHDCDRFEDYSSPNAYVTQKQKQQKQQYDSFRRGSDTSQPMSMEDLGEPLLDVQGVGQCPPSSSSSSQQQQQKVEQKQNESSSTTIQQPQQEKYDPDDPFHTMYEGEAEVEESAVQHVQNWLSKKGMNMKWGST